MRMILSLLSLVVLFSSFETRAVEPAKTPVSVSAKLYWVATLMDRHENAGQVSELLREVLEKDLDSDYLRSRIKKVKQYVDREWIRDASGSVQNSQLDTHSFLEARLLIVECLQEMRPRLNYSWTGEVRHAKKMLFTSIFPHAEEYGEIEFPDPKTYSFDTYGYTIKNLKELMITRGGKDLTPLFSEFLGTQKKKSYEEDDSEFIGANLSFQKISKFKDKVKSDLMKEGVDPNKLVPENAWDGSTPGSGIDPSGDWDNDDWDWRRRTAGEERILALKRIYRYLSKIVLSLRAHRSIDMYEPITLLMIAMANPALIEHDPQLRDFVSGVKFKFRVADQGPEGSFKPKDYRLVQLLNDALTPNQNVNLQFEVDNKTGQRILYVVSNLNGPSSIGMNVLNFKNIVMAIQTAKSMPDGVWDFAKATPENLTKLTEWLNKSIQDLNRNDNLIYKIIGTPAKVAFDITIALGSKTITKAATHLTALIKKLSENQKVVGAYNTIKSEQFIRRLVMISVALDLTQGVIELAGAKDDAKRIKILMHTTSKAGGTLIYLTKFRPAILVSAGFDIGHLLYDKIPSVAELFEHAMNFSFAKLTKLVTGASPKERELRKMKEILGIENQNEAYVALNEFERGTKSAQTLSDLEDAKAKLSARLGMYAAKRLVFHYVAVTALDGKGDRTLGLELRDQSEEYDRIYWTWFNPPGSSAPEQAGLSVLDREFNSKWIALGGKEPEKPVELPKKTGKPSKDQTPKKDDDFPWED